MAAVVADRSIAEVATHFSFSRDAIYDWIRRLAETGPLTPGTRQTGPPRALSSAEDVLLRDRIDGVLDATICDLRA
jgi:transposase